MPIDLGNAPTGTPPTAEEKTQILSALGIPDVSTRSGAENLSNKTLVSPAFSGTASGQLNLPTQTAASGASVLTRDLYDSRMNFQGPYVSQIVFGTGTTSGSTSVFRLVNAAHVTGVEFPNPAIAGTSAGYVTQQHMPVIGSDGQAVSVSGTGGLLVASKPYTLGVAVSLGLMTSTTADIITRFGIGNAGVSSNRLQGIGQNYGWGVRVWRNNATTWNVALYCRCHEFSNTVVTNVSNTSPIVVTTGATGHGFQNGDLVEMTTVGGNTAANGIWTVANRTTSTFELQGSTGNGAYTASTGLANKITSPITISHGTLRRFFVTSNGAGTLELRLGSMANAPSLTLTGMTSSQVVTGQIGYQFYFGMHSVTATDGFYSCYAHGPQIFQTL